MNGAILVRLAGLAALLGGLARIAVALPLPLGAQALEALYDLIDAALLFALMGVYLPRSGRLGALGLAAFACAIASLSFIGGPDADPFGFSTYEQGAYALAISLIGLSIGWLRAGERPFAPPLLWIGSAVATGVLGLLPQPLPSYGFAAAGALFGAGFVAAGVDLLRRSA